MNGYSAPAPPLRYAKPAYSGRMAPSPPVGRLVTVGVPATELRRLMPLFSSPTVMLSPNLGCPAPSSWNMPSIMTSLAPPVPIGAAMRDHRIQSPAGGAKGLDMIVTRPPFTLGCTCSHHLEPFVCPLAYRSDAAAVDWLIATGPSGLRFVAAVTS